MSHRVVRFVLLAGFAINLVPPSSAQRSPLVLEVGISRDANSVAAVAAWQEKERDEFHRQGLVVAGVDDFPAFVGASVSAGTRLAMLGLGLRGGFGSTGGKLHYRDYSGEAATTRRLTRSYIGPYAEADLARFAAVSLYGAVRTQVSFVRVDYQRTLTVDQEDVAEPIKRAFRGTSYSVEPEIGLAVDIVPQLFLRTRIGYEVSIASSALQDDGLRPMLGTAAPPPAAWEGLRLGFSVGLRLRTQ